MKKAIKILGLLYFSLQLHGMPLKLGNPHQDDTNYMPTRHWSFCILSSQPYHCTDDCAERNRRINDNRICKKDEGLRVLLLILSRRNSKNPCKLCETAFQDIARFLSGRVF